MSCTQIVHDKSPMNSVDASSLPENKKKNRFKNIKCCKKIEHDNVFQLMIYIIFNSVTVDETRVILTPIEGAEHDYINANFIDVS